MGIIELFFLERSIIGGERNGYNGRMKEGGDPEEEYPQVEQQPVLMQEAPETSEGNIQ